MKDIDRLKNDRSRLRRSLSVSRPKYLQEAVHNGQGHEVIENKVIGQQQQYKHSYVARQLAYTVVIFRYLDSIGWRQREVSEIPGIWHLSRK